MEPIMMSKKMIYVAVMSLVLCATQKAIAKDSGIDANWYRDRVVQVDSVNSILQNISDQCEVTEGHINSNCIEKGMNKIPSIIQAAIEVNPALQNAYHTFRVKTQYVLGEGVDYSTFADARDDFKKEITKTLTLLKKKLASLPVDKDPEAKLSSQVDSYHDLKLQLADQTKQIRELKRRKESCTSSQATTDSASATRASASVPAAATTAPETNKGR
jgi:hypothetical protein